MLLPRACGARRGRGGGGQVCVCLRSEATSSDYEELGRRCESRIKRKLLPVRGDPPPRCCLGIRFCADRAVLRTFRSLIDSLIMTVLGSDTKIPGTSCSDQRSVVAHEGGLNMEMRQSFVPRPHRNPACLPLPHPLYDASTRTRWPVSRP